MAKQYSPPRKAAVRAESALAEVLDVHGAPLAVLPLESVVAQRLRHASVSVLFFGSEKRLLLTRRTNAPSEAWDLPAQGPILAGEAGKDTALRLLREKLHISHARVIACPPVAGGNSLLSVFKADSAHESPRPAADSECLFADTDELAALIMEFSEMLSKQLLSVVRQYLLPAAFLAEAEKKKSVGILLS